MNVTTSGPGQSAKLLVDITFLLDKRGIRYVVVGALAAAYHGVVRASLDADALIALPSEGEMEVLINSLRSLGLSVDYASPGLDDPLSGLISIADSFGNQVDLILGIRGIGKQSFERAVTTPLFGKEIKIIGAEDFVAMKIFAGGPQDIEDVRGVLRVFRPGIDLKLVKNLLAGYGSNEKDLFEKLLGEG